MVFVPERDLAKTFSRRVTVMVAAGQDDQAA